MGATCLGGFLSAGNAINIVNVIFTYAVTRTEIHTMVLYEHAHELIIDLHTSTALFWALTSAQHFWCCFCGMNMSCLYSEYQPCLATRVLILRYPAKHSALISILIKGIVMRKSDDGPFCCDLWMLKYMFLIYILLHIQTRLSRISVVM